MKYKVFQDNKSADPIGYPSITGKDWANSEFETIDEAIRYAHLWAYPFTIDTLPTTLLNMEVGIPVNMSMGECPVMMEIRLID